MIEFNTPRFAEDVSKFINKNDVNDIAADTKLSVSSIYRMTTGVFPNLRTFTTLVNAMGKTPGRYFTKG